MATPTYTVACIGNELIAKDIYEVRFEKPEGFTFKPGQFILFDIPHPDNADDIQARAFSIASTPAEQDLLFVIKLTPGGRASQWVERKLKAGGTIVMKGPFGFFTVKDDDAKDLLFICTSTGNAPFRSQALALLEKGDVRKLDMIYGVRSEEDLFWQKEFTELSQRYPHFTVHFTLTQPSDAWTGHRGRVQTLVPLLARDIALRSVYVCGSPNMTKEVKQLCLEHWGVQKQNLHVEGYI